MREAFKHRPSRPQSDETKRKIGEKAKQRWASGRQPVNFKPRFEYNGRMFRSRWECFVAEALDTANILWEYESQRFHLPCGTFMPDFYLPEFGLWIEVKGWMTETAREKILQFRQTGRCLVVVDEVVGRE